MENSSENIDTNVINLHLTNLFCVLRKYLNITICQAACINITNRILSNESNQAQNLANITEQMNNMIKNNEFKCDKNLTKSFLEYIVIPDIVVPDIVVPDVNKEEWKTEQDKLCKEKNFITCKLPGDCKYENSTCVSDEAKYTLEKLEAMKQKNQEIAQATLNATNENERKKNELTDFNTYVDLSTDKNDWVDRISEYCNVKDETSCGTQNNGCTMPIGSNKCIPDVDDYEKRSKLNYDGVLTISDPAKLTEKKNKRVEWTKMQDTLCSVKDPCKLPFNNCIYENKKCSADNNQYTEEKYTKLNNETRAKKYLNELDVNEWTNKLTKYCNDKDSIACSTNNNACTFKLLKQKCIVDTNDYGKKDKLRYTDNLEEIINVMNEADAKAKKEADAKAAEEAKANEVKPSV